MQLGGREVPTLEFAGDGTRFSARIRSVLPEGALFARFDSDEIDALAAYLQVYRVGAGLAFITEGDPGDFMAIIIEGRVDVYKQQAYAERTLMGSVGPGKTLGEMSLVDGEPRFATCIAAEPTLFAVLSGAALQRILTEAPQLGQKILLHLLLLLNQRLRAVSAKLVEALAR